MKRNHQAKDILKEDCQAFGTIIAKTLILYEAFQYPITSVHYLLHHWIENCDNLKMLF